MQSNYERCASIKTSKDGARVEHISLSNASLP